MTNIDIAIIDNADITRDKNELTGNRLIINQQGYTTINKTAISLTRTFFI